MNVKDDGSGVAISPKLAVTPILYLSRKEGGH